MVSIVLVTYKRVKRLRLAILDILNQSFQDFELIICDDCSPDDTQQLCEAFAARDKRIRYYRQTNNVQMPANLNFGLSQAKHEYVAILHGGDRFRYDLIEQWYNAMRANESVGFVFNSIGETDELDRIEKSYHEFNEGVIKKEDLLQGTFFRRRHFDSPVWGEAMVKKSVVQEYGLLQSKYGFYADVDLWMGILQTHDAYYCADTLFTGPSKDVQPHLFTTDLIKVYLYMFDMHWTHRKKAFGRLPLKFMQEMVRFYVYAFFHLTYNLILLQKNFPVARFMEAPDKLKKHPILLLPWVATALMYPVLKPMLVLFEWSKGPISVIREAPKRTLRYILAGKASVFFWGIDPASALIAENMVTGL